MLSLPTYSGKSKHPSYALKRKGLLCELISSTPEPNLCFISELMCINTKRLQAFGGLQEHYFHPAFSWIDLISSARCQGQTIEYLDIGTSKKQALANHLFSYQLSTSMVIKDSYLFQWRFCRSFLSRFNRFWHILNVCFCFKPRQLAYLIHAYLCWICKGRPFQPNWFICCGEDVLN